MHLQRRRTNLHLQTLFAFPFPFPRLSMIPADDVTDFVGLKAAPHLLSSSSSSSFEFSLADLKFLMPINNSSLSQFRQWVSSAIG